MPTVWAALRNCCAKLPFLLSEVVFISRCAEWRDFLPADKVIFRSDSDGSQGKATQDAGKKAVQTVRNAYENGFSEQ